MRAASADAGDGFASSIGRSAWREQPKRPKRPKRLKRQYMGSLHSERGHYAAASCSR
ncbi:MAG: hypothetical protein U0575_08440 [Phycisphaerales bacterium]